MPDEEETREVAVKRKTESQTKTAVLNLPLLNKPKNTPKFARVSELGVCNGQASTKTQKANVSKFEASARALEGGQEKK